MWKEHKNTTNTALYNFQNIHKINNVNMKLYYHHNKLKFLYVEPFNILQIMKITSIENFAANIAADTNNHL